ncbi:MAG: ABC transporter substrate-binding protein [Oscillatoriales cyanobacterium SM2_2_1]|nr:ABC transporter substrate-binding protein [Oscillatoriales cyanobacterium SM2_2_1]
MTSLTADIIAKLNPQVLVGVPGGSLTEQNPALRSLPRVSQGRVQPNLEQIIALRPDLVWGAKSFHESLVERLGRSRIPVTLTDVRNWSELEALTRDIATQLGTDPQPLLRRYQSIGISQPKRQERVLVLVSSQPILSPNKNSWAGAMLERFGMNNVTANVQGTSFNRGYVTLSPERVLQENPDVIILVEVGGGESLKNQLAGRSFWRNLAAVRKGRVVTMEYLGLVNPGNIDAIEKASARLRAIAQ